MGLQQMIQTVAMGGTTRNAKLVLIADGKAYLSTNLTAPVIVAAAVVPVLAADVQMCQISGPGTVYIVNNFAGIKQLNAATSAMVVYTATAGVAPLNCSLCCIYRDRLVVSGRPGEEQNYFASRSGDQRDWDYAKRDASAAFAGNNTPAGLLGDIVTALIPAGVDSLIFGCDHSIYRMVGDITAGGRIDFVTDRVGVLGPDAWCRDPQGTIYFASRSGLFTTESGATLKNLSLGRYTNFFAGLNRNEKSVQLRWDQKRFGVWIFVTDRDGNSESLHCFYDARNDGFFEQQFPTSFGPVCSLSHEGDDPDDTRILLGGRDGFIRLIDDTATDDDGTAIASYAYLSPQRPAGDTRHASLIALDATLGEQPPGTTGWNLDWQIQLAEDLHKAVTAPTQQRNGSWASPGKQTSIGLRVGGLGMVLRLGNNAINKTWTCERITARMHSAGRTR